MFASCGFSLSSNDDDSVVVVPAVLTAARCTPPVALLSLLLALVPVALRDPPDAIFNRDAATKKGKRKTRKRPLPALELVR